MPPVGMAENNRPPGRAPRLPRQAAAPFSRYDQTRPPSPVQFFKLACKTAMRPEFDTSSGLDGPDAIAYRSAFAKDARVASGASGSDWAFALTLLEFGASYGPPLRVDRESSSGWSQS